MKWILFNKDNNITLYYNWIPCEINGKCCICAEIELTNFGFVQTN